MTSDDLAEAAPPLRVATLALILGCLSLGAVSALEIRHMSVAHGFPLRWSAAFATTMPRWTLLAATLPFVLRLATRPRLRTLRRTSVLVHLGMFIAISAAHAVTQAWALPFSNPVALLFPWSARLTRAWFGAMPIMVSVYGATLAAAWAIREASDRERRAIRASQLEAQLQAAHLTVLRARLQPHFLYNTLNGIAALVVDMRPAQAVAAIDQLSELLHASLRDDGRNVVSVREEVALAEQYLALQKMRFGDRLTHGITLAPEVAECMVPVLLLQPLVENAVVHGLEAGVARLQVAIAANAAERGVELRVENDGPALDGSAAAGGNGVGLAATRARLAAAYGDRASLQLLPRAGGGVVVCLVVPRSGPGEAAEDSP